MTLGARAPGVALTLAGVAVAIEASTFEVAFLTDPVGPKALPYLVATVLALSGLHATIRPPALGGRPSPAALSRAGAATGTFLAYALALPYVGFFASTTLVVAILSRLFGAAWVRALVAAALLSAALWLIFVWALGLPLPIGELWIR